MQFLNQNMVTGGIGETMKVGKDKLGHVLVNTIIVLVFGLGDIWAAVGLALAASIVKEGYDFVTPGRSCNPWDLVADGVGIGLGLLIWALAGVVT